MPIHEVDVPTDIYQLDRRLADGFIQDNPPEEFDEEGEPIIEDDDEDFTPPVTRNKLWSFNDGDVSDGDWNDFLGTMLTHPSTGTPWPAPVQSGGLGNNYILELPVANTFLNPPINYEVPIMTSGRLLHSVSLPASSHDGHCLIRVRAPDSLDGLWDLYHGVIYRFDLEFEFLNTSSWLSTIPWAVIFEVAGRYGTFQGIRNPYMSLIVDGNDFASLSIDVQVRGSSNTSDWQYKKEQEFHTPVSPTGTHTATVWWKADHLGKNSRCKVIVDGTTVCDVTNVKLGLPFDADNKLVTASENASGGFVQFGMYTQRIFAAPGCQIYFDKVEVSVVDSI